MKKIHNTVSLCNECYRHIPGKVYEDAGLIKMLKTCPTHGTQHSIVETDPQFYYSLRYNKDYIVYRQLLFEVTDRCNLNCPHCYHETDNKTIDVPIENIINRIKVKYPENKKSHQLVLAGAEPTVRKDLPELLQELSKFDTYRGIGILTNGIRFNDNDFVKSLEKSDLKQVYIGLNHPSYQGNVVHTKQLEGIKNIVENNIELGYIGYTLESLDHLQDVLDEIKTFHNTYGNKVFQYRIRCGSFIGKSGDTHRSYLSSLVKKVMELTNNEATLVNGDDNPYHIMVEWSGIVLRLIQWPDVTNIDLEELATGPWCDFINDDISNFVHQIILRDAFINKKLPQLDKIPEKYTWINEFEQKNPYWKDNY